MGGDYSHKFRIGVCLEESKTLTLFKGLAKLGNTVVETLLQRQMFPV